MHLKIKCDSIGFRMVLLGFRLFLGCYRLFMLCKIIEVAFGLLTRFFCLRLFLVVSLVSNC